MTQIVVTLENGADSTFIRRMIENMKGVLNASVHRQPSVSNETKVRQDSYCLDFIALAQRLPG